MQKPQYFHLRLALAIILSLTAISTHAIDARAQGEQVTQTVIDETEDGYKISLPDIVARSFPQDRELILSVRHPDGSVSAVTGRASANAEGGVEMKTEERLRHLARERGSIINFFDPSGPSEVGGCLLPEHGIGCFFAGICVGTTYCLPGGDPDTGFTCECL